MRAQQEEAAEATSGVAEVDAADAAAASAEVAGTADPAGIPKQQSAEAASDSEAGEGARQ